MEWDLKKMSKAELQELEKKLKCDLDRADYNDDEEECKKFISQLREVRGEMKKREQEDAQRVAAFLTNMVGGTIAELLPLIDPDVFVNVSYYKNDEPEVGACASYLDEILSTNFKKGLYRNTVKEVIVHEVYGLVLIVKLPEDFEDPEDWYDGSGALWVLLLEDDNSDCQ